jgi:hypothetical protein
MWRRAATSVEPWLRSLHAARSDSLGCAGARLCEDASNEMTSEHAARAPCAQAGPVRVAHVVAVPLGTGAARAALRLYLWIALGAITVGSAAGAADPGGALLALGECPPGIANDCERMVPERLLQRALAKRWTGLPDVYVSPPFAALRALPQKTRPIRVPSCHTRRCSASATAPGLSRKSR